MRDEKMLRATLIAQPETGPLASPSLPYIKYILEDENVPNDIHPSLRRVVFDKEQALTNLRDEEIIWLRRQLSLAEIMFKMSRPALACNYQEEIIFSTLPAKHMVKLARSRDGGFERKQETTQTVIRRVEGISPGTVSTPSRWRRLLPGGGGGK